MIKRIVVAVALCDLLASCVSAPSTSEDVAASSGPHNNLTYAVAWKQTAAEYQALYHQGFNMARLRIQQALLEHAPGDKPLAIISDLDETLLLASDYWGYLINADKDFFDDSSWDAWVAEQRVSPSPGASEFLRYCAENNVEIFYVTNRDQGEATYALALQSLRKLDFPNADAAHLTVLRETSNKQTVQDAIREDYEVVVMLGDNLNDFSRQFYVTDVNARQALMTQERGRFGVDFIVFPNPTDGHWIRAIFGESEPAPSAANRAILKAAAVRQAWTGQ